MEQLFFYAAVVRWTIPIALAAIGGLYSERSGVINIGLEALLITGAFAGACGAYFGHSAWLGIAAGVTAAAALAALYAFLTVRLGADQIVTGVALNLLCEGLSRFLLKLIFGSVHNSEKLGNLGAAFRTGEIQELVMNPLVIATILAALATHGLLRSTRFGLRLRAAGDHPEAAASLGVDVRRVRFAAVCLSGALAGLGGVWLVLAQGDFSSGIAGGRGYIALAALIFGGWRPVPVLGAALLFGFLQAVSAKAQQWPAVIAVIPQGYLLLLPYVLTIVALMGTLSWSRRRTGAPAALGRRYEP